MNLRLVATCALLGAALTLSACDKGRQTPAKVTVRIVDVAPSFSQLQFRREQTNPSTLTFKNAQEFAYDADTYDFYVTEPSLTNGAGATRAFAQEMRGNHRYTFVLTEVAGVVQPVVLETPDPSATEAQIVGLHAGENLPAMDLYLVAPGAGIGGATPRGTLAVGGQLAASTVPTGDYEIWLTAVGDPATVLLTSTTITLGAGTSSVFIVTPEGGQTTETLSVLLLQATPTVILDRNATAELRVVNGATDMQPRDFAINLEFAPPLFSAIPFAEPTAYAEVPVGASQVNVTPVGNPGVLELDQTLSASAALRYLLLFTGDAGTLTETIVVEDRRRIAGEAKLRFLNAATQFAVPLDFVLVTSGGDPAGILGEASLGAPGASIDDPLPAGDYDLYLRENGTTTFVAGPVPFSVAAAGLYGAIAVNGPDTATANVIFYDDFP